MDEVRGSLNGHVLTMKRDRAKEEVMEDMGCVEVGFSNWKNTHYTYAYCDKPFALSDINEALSKEVQSRIQTKVIPENITKYANGMAAGNTFPAIVIYIGKDGKMHIIGDGLHTFFAALSLGITHIIGYYIFSHPQSDLVVPLFNIRNGQSVDYEATLPQAAKAFNQYEDDCIKQGTRLPVKKQWAERYSLDQTTFAQQCRCLRGKFFCMEHDVDPDAKPLQFKGAMDKIAGLAETNPEKALEIAELAVKFDLESKDTERICGIFSGRTASKSLKVREQEFEEAKLEIELKAPQRKAEGKNSKSPRAPARSDEKMIRDTLILIAERLESADKAIFKQMMMYDEHLTNAIKALARFCR